MTGSPQSSSTACRDLLVGVRGWGKLSLMSLHVSLAHVLRTQSWFSVQFGEPGRHVLVNKVGALQFNQPGWCVQDLVLV